MKSSFQFTLKLKGAFVISKYKWLKYNRHVDCKCEVTERVRECINQEYINRLVEQGFSFLYSFIV